MVLGIGNVSEPFGFEFRVFTLPTAAPYNSFLLYFLFRVRDDLEKEDAFRGLCAVVFLSPLCLVFETCK